MIRQPFHSEATQSEKRAMLRNDQRVARDATTYFEFASGEAEPGGGRFAEVNRISVTGATRQYPTLPESSPWRRDPVPPEEPLGIDLSAAPIVGEPFEVERSLRGMNDGAGMNNSIEPSIDSPTSGERCSDAGDSSDVIEPGSPLPKSRKRRRP